MENFPESFESVSSDSILEQFVQMKHYVKDKIEEIEEEIVQGDDTKVYFGTEKQEEVYFDSDPQTQITSNKNDITSLTTRVGTAENGIDNLETRASALENSVVKYTQQTLTPAQQAQARQNIGAGSSTINVIDDLTSTASYDALSANQGRVLNEKISGLQSSKQNLINGSNPLSADLVDDTNATNKFVHSSDIRNWNGKTTLNEVYPIGSIYLSVNSISPASLFGGTWERIKDKFLLSAGDTYSAGSTGGEATHTLTIDEMPSHSHNFLCATDSAGESNGARMAYNNYQWRGQMTSTGGDQPHNNMPPYLVVYVWKRTA